MTTYTIPKPTLPAAAWLLGAMVGVGLIGLAIAAFAAFSFIGNVLQALAFALIVEAGMISEAIAIIRRNWLAIPGLIVSLLVSGMYNYTQAARAGLMMTPALTDSWQLAALSIGPLSAVFFLALATGRELSEHEKRVQSWAAERQRWIDDQAEKEARRQERREARQEKAAAQLAQTESANQVQLHSGPRVAAQPAQRGTFEDFRSAQLARNGAGPMDYKQVMERFNVSRRTAYGWLARLEQENTQVITLSEN